MIGNAGPAGKVRPVCPSCDQAALDRLAQLFLLTGKLEAATRAGGSVARRAGACHRRDHTASLPAVPPGQV